MPLLLRGARQVGKSWLINEFGKTFENFVELNFEKEGRLKRIFEENLGPATLLPRLNAFAKKKIDPATTLLFFDEIQECPNAIKALRYFKEEMPELPVIATGSLLEFELEKIGVPVGRMEFAYLYPLSWGEFLSAAGRDDLREFCRSQSNDTVIHDVVLDYLAQYFWLGGMPQVLDAWIKEKDSLLCQKIQDQVIGTYRQDFVKYAKKRQIENVSMVFNAVPLQIGRKFKFSHVSQEHRTYQIRDALDLLIKAGVALPCYHSSGQGQPLGGQMDPKKFKIFFLDLGLCQRMLGLDLRDWTTSPTLLSNKGGLAEQFVVQEFAKYGASWRAPELFYWHREDPQGNAEVDMLAIKKGRVVPVEIKSGTKGDVKSLLEFLKTHPNSPCGLKIANKGFFKHAKFEEIPLYGIEGWVKPLVVQDSNQ